MILGGRSTVDLEVIDIEAIDTVDPGGDGSTINVEVIDDQCRGHIEAISNQHRGNCGVEISSFSLSAVHPVSWLILYFMRNPILYVNNIELMLLGI